MRLRPDLMPGNGQVVWMCNWAGGVPTVEGREIEPDSTCSRALNQLSILWDGTVTLCCYDPLAKHNLGNLKEQSIREVYNGEWYTQFREDHFNEKASKYEICRGWVTRPDISTQVRFRKQEELERRKAELGGGKVRILTACPSCLQGLSRYREDTGIEPDYIVVEMAKKLLGENWLADYVARANAGGIERVLL